jgi:hypothetical protein
MGNCALYDHRPSGRRDRREAVGQVDARGWMALGRYLVRAALLRRRRISPSDTLGELFNQIAVAGDNRRSILMHVHRCNL